MDAAAAKSLSFPALVRAIWSDWKGVSYAARPYLSAMSGLASPLDNYGADSGPSVIRYFLANAAGWRGPVAKAVKAELKARISGAW